MKTCVIINEYKFSLFFSTLDISAEVVLDFIAIGALVSVRLIQVVSQKVNEVPRCSGTTKHGS